MTIVLDVMKEDVSDCNGPQTWGGSDVVRRLYRGVSTKRFLISRRRCYQERNQIALNPLDDSCTIGSLGNLWIEESIGWDLSMGWRIPRIRIPIPGKKKSDTNTQKEDAQTTVS